MLVADILTHSELEAMIELSHNFGMETLVEVHNATEIAKIPLQSDLVGVNNRNINNFITDVDASFNLINRLPQGITKIAESGICSHYDIHRLRAIGYSGFLIGNTFMKRDNPGQALHEFINPQKHENNEHPNKR